MITNLLSMILYGIFEHLLLTFTQGINANLNSQIVCICTIKFVPGCPACSHNDDTSHYIKE